jgi:hypothetical protein
LPAQIFPIFGRRASAIEAPHLGLGATPDFHHGLLIQLMMRSAICWLFLSIIIM